MTRELFGQCLRIIGSPVMLSLGMRGLAISLKTLQVIALIHMYGAHRFGVYSVAVGVFTLAMVLGRLGLDHYSLREANNRIQTSYHKTVEISFGVAAPSLVVAILALGVTHYFYSSEVFEAFSVFAIAAPVYAVVWNQVFILRGAGWVNKSLFLFEIANPILLLGFSFSLRNFEMGLPLAFLAAILVTSVLTYLNIVKLLRGAPTRIAAPATIKSAVSVSRSFYALSIVQAIQSLADSLAVGFFLRPFDVAVYAIITRVGTVALLPVTITTIYMNNIVARLRTGPLLDILRELRPLILVNVAMSTMMSMTALTILPFVGLIFKVNFTPEAEAAYILVIAAQFTVGSTAFVHSIMYMSGRERYASRIAFVLLIPYLLALGLMTADWGILLVGIAFFTSTVMNQLILASFLFGTIWQERSEKM